MKRHSLCVTKVPNWRRWSFIHEAPDREIHNDENFLRNLNRSLATYSSELRPVLRERALGIALKEKATAETTLNI